MKKNSFYQLKFFLNASHAIRWKDGIGQEHPHTYEIICEIRPDEFLRFNDIEAKVNGVLEQYNNKLLNDTPAFKELNPTLENLTEVLFDEIEEQLQQIECHLLKIQVGESPTRYYCLTQE